MDRRESRAASPRGRVVTLLALIKKGALRSVANANPAKVANDEAATDAPLAELAALALADPQNPNAAIAPMTASEAAAIRRWLAHIGETDAVMVAHVMEQCSANADKRGYYLARSEEAPAAIADQDGPRCTRCEHRKGRAGVHWGCVAREDLPPLYGLRHPLRELPSDGGVNCARFEPHDGESECQRTPAVRMWH